MNTANVYGKDEMAHSVRGFGHGEASYAANGGQIIQLPTHAGIEKEKVLPLPGWLVKLYFIFPVVLYVPDIIFNYVVYSTGVQPTNNTVLYVASVVLWIFLSIGVVGMAYLLSVLAPWHWGQGHRIQAFFCGLGVVIATAITTWNSLAFRSRDFVSFKTDDWVYSIWPQLQADKISITMILVAMAPPFWGLFWAIVQPTETGRSLRQLQESHEERLLRMQQEAELKRLKAETSAKVREAQLRGMAATAAAAREQARGLLVSRQDTSSNAAVADVAEVAAAEADVVPTDDQVATSEMQADVVSAGRSAKDADVRPQGRQTRQRATTARTRGASPAGTSTMLATAASTDRAHAQVEPQMPDAQVARSADSGPMGRRSLSPTARDADLSHVRQPGDGLAGLAVTQQY